MKQIHILLKKAVFITFFLSLPVVAQDFLKVDKIVSGYPKSFTTPETLAEKIRKDFNRQDEIARAAFTWIALNIDYDAASYFSSSGQTRIAYSFRDQEEKRQKERAFEDQLINKTLRSNKAVCQGYATLFQRLCELNGVEAVLIAGTSKVSFMDIGKQPGKSDHAWNAVKINKEWKLIDVTWAAGALDAKTRKFVRNFNPGYFFSDPDIFFLNHFPDKKDWMLTEKTADDFAGLPLYHRQYADAFYTFLSPETGIINLKNLNSIRFKVENLNPKSLVTYVFTNKGQLIRILPEFKNNIAQFEIPVDSKANDFLTIYINNRAAVTYKLVR
ncbi:MAG TPA: transglutaminase domain-containing protein [Flavobacterium sp.]|jgi:transglutaminase/protease-like cytokinesis protein 3